MHLDFSMSRFGVKGSLELLVSDTGVDGALSSALDACKLNGNFIYKLIKDTRLKTTFTQS